MTNLRIYRLAMNELLRLWGFAKDKLEEEPNSQTSKHRVKKFENEMNKLQKMILKDERDRDSSNLCTDETS